MDFVCEHCDQAQWVDATKRFNFTKKFGFSQTREGGNYGFSIEAIQCSHPSCRKVSVNLVLGEVNAHVSAIFNRMEMVRVRPNTTHFAHSAKNYPDYIPQAILQDYSEACEILHLSPKASATLIRRCLQGAIRDFCKISKSTLDSEIRELVKRVNDGEAPKGVSIESVDGIDSVRKIGNIGAHMERDIDVIIPVEPEEAQLLIELTETLFEEWYIARHNREERFKNLTSLAEEKSSLKAAAKALPPH